MKFHSFLRVGESGGGQPPYFFAINLTKYLFFFVEESLKQNVSKHFKTIFFNKHTHTDEWTH